MIGAGYVVMMSRYNAWQNNQVVDIVKVMDEAALYKDHKAFFGSIMHTLNHILWGDTLWMSRFSDAFDPPTVPAAEHYKFTPSPEAWCAVRGETDGRIRAWADRVVQKDLDGKLSWYSGVQQAEMTQDRAMCIVQLFNHQTHHRGQVHAMLTASGQSAPTTDVPFMPEDA